MQGNAALKHRLILGTVIAVAIVVGSIVHGLWVERQRLLADATLQTAKLRDAMSEQTRQTLIGLRLALNGVAEEVDPGNLGAEATFSALTLRQRILNTTYALFVLDEQGQLVATSRTPEPEAVDFSDIPSFEAHRDDSGLGVFIGQPRLGRVGFAAGRWVLPLSKRLNHPDGRFAGIVSAVVSVDMLTSFYDTFRIGPRGVAGLIHENGTLLVSNPVIDDWMGAVPDELDQLVQILPSMQSGVIRADFVADGIDRIYAYKQVEGFAAAVYVGVAVPDLLAGWRQRIVVDTAIGLLAVATLIVFAFQIMRRIRERQDEQDTRVAQLRKLTDHATQVFECPDVQTALQYAAEIARQLVPCHQAVTGLTADASMAQTIHAVSLSDKYADWRTFQERPDGSGIYREVCLHNRPMRLTQRQLEAHPAFRGFGEARDRHPPIRGWLAVPLIGDGGSNLGLIQLSDRIDGDFSAEDEALIVELAHSTSAAIQRLRLTETLHAAMQHSDRLRMEAEDARAAEADVRNEIETVLSSIRDAVVAIDADWRFTFLNQKAEELLQMSAAELIGKDVWATYPRLVDGPVHAKCREAAETRRDQALEYHDEIQGKWFDVRVFPQDRGGMTIYFADMTSIVEREEQLRQAQKMEAVGQLTGGLAHDFNNLLTVIIGNAELALDRTERSDPLYRLISMIEDAATRASDLTQRLLAFSRRQPLDPRAVDVSALVRDLEPLLTRTLGEAYRIELHLTRDMDFATVDPGQLQNAITNLVINARDAMPDGGTVTIGTSEVQIDDDYSETHAYAAPGRYVMISVADNGTGMPPEVRERAFEPFFTTKPKGRGTGLGLPMVFGFIRQSKGHINLYSEPGEGTEVKLYLPCIGAEASVSTEDDGGTGIRRGAERILVVEDDAMVREYARTTLVSLGYEVVAVADGTSAKSILEGDAPFDLLLCDVILGDGVNGRQVAEMATKIQPALKVLFMSGYSNNVIVHHGRLDPGVRLLLKPFRRGDLADKVRDAIDEGL